MSADAPARRAPWGLQQGAGSPARTAGPVAGSTPQGLWPRFRGAIRRLTGDDQPQSADELLAYATHLERDMPGLAADLRAAALRHDPTLG